MPLFRKNPVLIEARQFTKESALEVAEWCEGNLGLSDNIVSLIIHTLEGDHKADEGDWIIKGVRGEFYPCRLDIFEETYREV